MSPSKRHSGHPAPGSAPIAVALGGGGARGFAHIVLIEALDELGLKPARIAGTSIGAVLGAAWAAGMSGLEMRSYVQGLLRDRTGILARVMKARAGRFADIFTGQIGNPILLDPQRILDAFWPGIVPDRFDQLDVAFDVVATDYYGRKQVMFHEGPLAPAVAASMAIPGMFKPVHKDERVLVDGGIVNPLPYSHLIGGAAYVIACDVTGGPVEGKRGAPTPFEALFGASQIMQASITAQMLKAQQPDLLIKPDVDRYRILDFFRAVKIMDDSEPVKDEIKRALEKRLTRAGRQHRALS